MAARPDLRRAVQRHVAFDLRSRAELGAIVYADLNRTPGVRLSSDDLAALLEALTGRSPGDPTARKIGKS